MHGPYYMTCNIWLDRSTRSHLTLVRLFEPR